MRTQPIRGGIDKRRAQNGGEASVASASPVASDARVAKHEGAEERLLHSAVRPPQSLEIDHLCQKWRLAITPSRTLPPFEELALGNLGRLADSAALVSASEPGALEILMGGPAFEAWIDHPSRKLKITDVSTGSARALEEVVTQALKASHPAQTVAHAIVNGFVCSYDILALPLSNRWGPPLCLVYIEEQDRKYNLVDAMFEATNEGLVALAVVRDSRRAPSDFQIVAVNKGAARLMNRTVAELRGKRLFEVFVDPAAQRALSPLFSVLESGGGARFELDAPSCPSGALHLNVNASAMGDLVAVTLTDISDLKAREASFKLLFDGSPVPTVLCDPESLGFLAVNDAATELWGYSRDALLRMNAFDIIPQDDFAKARTRAEIGADLVNSEQLWRHRKADGSLIDVLVYARAITFGGRPAHLATLIDVTEKRQAEARIAHMAHHDALTDLPNRLLFHERLDEALSRVRRYGETLAVFYLDLDQFKNINDTLGHPIGDMLLQAVAERLRACLRDTDVVARFGGDEFGVIQMGLDGPAEAGAFAMRLVALLSQPYEINGHHVVIGASVGIALGPSDGEASDQLLKNADLALYRAKADGRGAYRFFEPGMDARVRARRSLELDLRNALSAGEFELYYQPLVSLASAAVTGFEALLRWRHPLRGMVAPAEFIPLAEEIGLIVPLGEWALRQACAEAATWPKALKVAVNLSSVQFKKGNLTHVVLTALASSGLPPARLELEITESILLAESEATLATLHRLRALGVSISMDDFGTGYSSLGYLRTFPFDKIKIDRSFISEVAENADCMAIVRAVTTLGASLGIATTAEGVETSEQLDWLRKEGCTEMQGYLFSRPIPASGIADLLTTRCGRAQLQEDIRLIA